MALLLSEQLMNSLTTDITQSV